MRQHYNLDRLMDYVTDEVSETTRVVLSTGRQMARCAEQWTCWTGNAGSSAGSCWTRRSSPAMWKNISKQGRNYTKRYLPWNMRRRNWRLAGKRPRSMCRWRTCPGRTDSGIFSLLW